MGNKTNYPFGNQFIVGIRKLSFFANVVGVDGCVYCVLRILRIRNLCGSVSYLLMRITYLLDIINGDFVFDKITERHHCAILRRACKCSVDCKNKPDFMLCDVIFNENDYFLFLSFRLFATHAS